MTLPESVLIKPASARIRVVLPLRVGPTKTVMPGLAVKEMSSRKTSPLCSSVKFLATSDTGQGSSHRGFTGRRRQSRLIDPCLERVILAPKVTIRSRVLALNMRLSVEISVEIFKQMFENKLNLSVGGGMVFLSNKCSKNLPQGFISQQE